MRCLVATALIVSFIPSQVCAQAVELRVAHAQPIFDEASQEGSVLVRLDRESARVFAEFTRAHLQQPINVLIDGEVTVTPFIQDPIVSGTFPISGLVSSAETDALSARLRSGRSIITVAPVN